MAKNFQRIGVITGDHRLSDPTKRDAQYNEEDAVTHNAMKAAFQALPGYTFLFYDDHTLLFDKLQRPIQNVFGVIQSFERGILQPRS